MKIENEVAIVSNYATYALRDTLQNYGEKGYRLVNAVLAYNTHNTLVMYCFFTRESAEE